MTSNFLVVTQANSDLSPEEQHCEAPPAVVPEIHNGTLRYDDIVDFENFKQHCAGMGLPEPSSPAQVSLVERLWSAVTRPHDSSRRAVRRDLEKKFRYPPSYDEFALAIKSKRGNTAGGISGLTYTMMKHWPKEVTMAVHTHLCTLWRDRSIPPEWKWRWLAPIPKKTTGVPTVADLRPIMLIEVIRKTWTGLIMSRITKSLLKHDALSACQHDYLRHKGTDSANLQLVNVLETAREELKTVYGSSWDISKAFESVSKSLIRLAWTRLGVPEDIVEWLVTMHSE